MICVFLSNSIVGFIIIQPAEFFKYYLKIYKIVGDKSYIRCIIEWFIDANAEFDGFSRETIQERREAVYGTYHKNIRNV